jgi:competence protein ComEA
MLQRVGPFLGGLLGGLLAAGVILLIAAGPRGQPIQLEPPPTPQPVRVHVAGAVLHPGVYELPLGSIVEQAVQAAGGPLPQALVDRVNLAEAVQDGQRVYLPEPEAELPQAGGTPAASSASADGVDINSASAPELERLPGIGPALAEAIVEYRESHGLFQTVDDLLDVPGIGPAKLELLRPWVTLQ